MKSQNNIIIIILFLLIPFLLHSQTAIPGVQDYGVCPSVSTTFSFNVGSGCTGYSFDITQGTGDISQNGNTFTVIPDDIPQNLVVSFNAGSDPDCGSSETFIIPVLSINGEFPSISSVPSSIIAGRVESFSVTATQLYGYYGNEDYDEVPEYEWEVLTAGSWSISTNHIGGVVNKQATITTDLSNGAMIKVRAISDCGGSW